METFSVNSVDGTSVSVTFSDSPVNTHDVIENGVAVTKSEPVSYVVPDCPVDDESALVAYISAWWVAFKLQYSTAQQELHPLTGQTFETV